MTAARIRGIYATALTQTLTREGVDVVQPSEPIRDRFSDAFDHRPAAVRIDTSRDRQGVSVTGSHDAVERVSSILESTAIDTFCWEADVPAGAVFDAEVVETGGGRGATVDLGNGHRGYLRYDDVDGYVDEGNRYRVQVADPEPPWTSDDPRVVPRIEVTTGLLVLTQDRSGISAALDDDRGAELVGMTDLLDVDVPDGWGIHWRRAAGRATLEAMSMALERGADRARLFEDALADASDEPGPPGCLATPLSTAWTWFGRESRFALDEVRRAVAPTMAGHHRIKASDGGASVAVDFVEAVCGSAGERTRADADFYVDDDADADNDGDFDADDDADADEPVPGSDPGSRTSRDASTSERSTGSVADNESPNAAGNESPDATGTRKRADSDRAFPFEAVTRQFGPTVGDRVELAHGKPDGRRFALGTGTVTEWAPDGSITVERTMRGGGTYDALDVPIDAGDVAVTKVREGRWWYATTYRAEDGTMKGTYVNVCTPVELFPGSVRYVDLYVDVIRHADGDVAVVDEDELDEAVANGLVSEPLAEKATHVARAVRRALSK